MYIPIYVIKIIFINNTNSKGVVGQHEETPQAD